MKNKGVMISLAVIVLIGMVITTGTHRFIEKNSFPTSAAAGDLAAAGTAPETEKAARKEAAAQDQAAAAAEAADEQPVAYAGDFAGEDESGAFRTSGGTEGSGGGTDDFWSSESIVFSEDADSGDAGMRAGGSGGVTDQSTKTDILSPLEPGETQAVMPAEAKLTAESASGESLSYYVKRLQDLDSQIQKTREIQGSANGGNSAKSAASSELKLWDSELNTIYNAILDRLEQEQSEALVKEERAWLKERDSLAMEAAQKTAGGSGESIEYTLSLMESTRQRAYELAEQYAWLLE